MMSDEDVVFLRGTSPSLRLGDSPPNPPSLSMLVLEESFKLLKILVLNASCIHTKHFI